jgi:DNA-binding NarL/FixJ family response regulator
VIAAAGALFSPFFYISYVRPVTDVIETLKRSVALRSGQNSPDAEVAGMNAVFELMREFPSPPPDVTAIPPDDESEDAAEEPADTGADGEYRYRLNTLSDAEKKVFDLYVQGYSAPDISRALNISVNTVKSHNRSILAKMRAASKKELISANIKMIKGEARERK